MRKFSVIFVVFLLGLLTVSSPVAGQDMMGFTFCGDLSAQDCDLLVASQEAMKGLESTALEVDMSFKISGVPDMPFEALAFGLNLDGAAAVDPALTEMLQQMQEDPMQFADPQTSMTIMSDLISGIDGDFTVTVNLPPELLAMAGPGGDMPSNLTFDVRLVDGVMYFNFDALAEAMPDAGLPPGWMGVDLASLFSQFGDMGMAMGSSNMIDQDAMTEYMQNLMDPETLGQFLTIERVEDQEVMGQTVAVFESNFDLGAFIQSDVYQNMLTAQMEIATGDADLSTEGQAEMNKIMTAMMDSMQGLVFEQSTAVGLDDHYVHWSTMNVNWNMDSFLNAIAPESEVSGAEFAFDMTISWSDFNSPVTVDVPENANLIPLGGMMAGAGSS